MQKSLKLESQQQLFGGQVGRERRPKAICEGGSEEEEEGRMNIGAIHGHIVSCELQNTFKYFFALPVLLSSRNFCYITITAKNQGFITFLLALQYIYPAM